VKSGFVKESVLEISKIDNSERRGRSRRVRNIIDKYENTAVQQDARNANINSSLSHAADFTPGRIAATKVKKSLLNVRIDVKPIQCEMTPSRKAAVQSKRVTRSKLPQSQLVEDDNVNTDSKSELHHTTDCSNQADNIDVSMNASLTEQELMEQSVDENSLMSPSFENKSVNSSPTRRSPRLELKKKVAPSLRGLKTRVTPSSPLRNSFCFNTDQLENAQLSDKISKEFPKEFSDAVVVGNKKFDLDDKIDSIPKTANTFQKRLVESESSFDQRKKRKREESPSDEVPRKVCAANINTAFNCPHYAVPSTQDSFFDRYFARFSKSLFYGTAS
jgi:hypothetical protein